MPVTLVAHLKMIINNGVVLNRVKNLTEILPDFSLIKHQIILLFVVCFIKYFLRNIVILKLQS